ncbi:unnamed protein product [Polarella glacialis]|nr:unnamed protein product [Polarella glacialis]
MSYRRSSSVSICRAALIRANACRFADRYCLQDSILGEGSFGRVHRCVDKFGNISRAVKRLRLPPEGSLQQELVNEIDALIALDHPVIVRLIEYFVEGSELLLVMELLQGPSLGDKMRELGVFPESFAVRCLRHMLKALFCCHCHGIAHNDVSQENFRFETCRPEASLRMVDFGLSEMSSQDPTNLLPHMGPERALYVQKRDIWSVGTIFYEMLTGCRLFLDEQDGASQFEEVTNVSYVPSRLQALDASKEAKALLSSMLELSTERRIAAQEALHHPLLIRSYASSSFEAEGEIGQYQSGGASSSRSRRSGRILADCVPALRAFTAATNLKRLALLVAAHLLSDGEVDKMRWTFRYLAQDGWKVEERRFREALTEKGEELPQDFSELFENADCSGSGALDFVEFMAAAISTLPEIYCGESSLKAIFHFFDTRGAGLIQGASLHALFPARTEADCTAMIRASCGKDAMSFADFCQVMTPEDWEGTVAAASWADKASPRGQEVCSTQGHGGPCGQEDLSRHGPSAAEETEGEKRQVNAGLSKTATRVTSAPSQGFAIRQEPGFHTKALRPFYEAQPISNVVLGIAQGTSGYARRAFALGCAEVVESEGGAFFFMPNPKYHWTPEAAKNAERKARFVAWWIHPALCDSLRAWTGLNGSATSFSRSITGDAEEPSSIDHGVGSPGDFGFSSMAKPPGYLHTCRDLAGEDHLRMLDALVCGSKRYLQRMFGESLPGAHVSAGFHYPVRPQYSTLHLQIRVNTGDVCPGEGRGVDLFRFLHRLNTDSVCLMRDEELLFYEATANLRAALLRACHQAGTPTQEVGPMSLVLGS